MTIKEAFSAKTRFSIFLVAMSLLLASSLAGQDSPQGISDAAFWGLVTDLSEAGGPFPSDNFVSNERSYQDVIPDLKQRIPTGGVYVGVGPEQNFTYIAAIQPRIAFIVDIRRQNLIEQLMYKALFELSADRREFVSRLFSRTVTAGPEDPGGFEALLASLRSTPPSASAYGENLTAIWQQLTETHGFRLSEGDKSSLEHVLRAFYSEGPGINYNGPAARNPGNVFPTYEELILQIGAYGARESFLSSDEKFRIVQELEKANRIVPLVGDFAGGTALRGVGDYLRKNNASLSVFYTSNVEQYLFGDAEAWRVFYRNVASLPVESGSVFIRALVRTDAGAYTVVPMMRPGYFLETMLYSIPALVSRFETGGIHNYADVLQTANVTMPDSFPGSIELSGPTAGGGEALNLKPPTLLEVNRTSSSEISLTWPNTGPGYKTGFLISKQAAEEWVKPIRVNYAAVCGSNPCVFRDSGLREEVRYCYIIQAVDDHSNLIPPNTPRPLWLAEDFGTPSETVCSAPPEIAK